MLKIQNWLRHNNGNLELLEQQLGITAKEHEDGRVIFNYSQIDSPKNNPIVKECRGLVLDKNDNWRLVAKAFNRFFNLGELIDLDREFDWGLCHAEDKEDGSLILMYYWNGKWHINTRNSFSDGIVNDSPWTWRDLVLMTLPDNWERSMNPNYTYVFELCTPYNKVVRMYREKKLFLLTMYHNDHMYEATLSQIDAEAVNCNFDRPLIHNFNDSQEVENYIRMVAREDKTFEGIVVRDGNNMRMKIKSAEYVALHRMSNNGNIASVKNLLPFVLEGETDELLCYFPECEPFLNKVAEKLGQWEKELDNLWFVYQDEDNRKKFALAVKDHPLSCFLFTSKDNGLHPWINAKEKPEILLKQLKGLENEYENCSL